MAYFELFPKILYDIEGKQLSKYSVVTNIFFRVRILRNILGNISVYAEYLIKDGETPETLADRFYGNPEAHWIIVLANEIIDPQFDWPLTTEQFNKYIIGKYGSIQSAQTTVHHYEKVIRREDASTGESTTTYFTINESEISETESDVPYDTYDSLAETQEVKTVNMGDGQTILEITSRRSITNYDYEFALNEKKRAIKIIKPDYYGQIIREFNELVGKAKLPYIRKLT